MKRIASVDIGSFVLYGAVLVAFWTFVFGIYYWLLGWLFGAQAWYVDMNLANWTAYTLATFFSVRRGLRVGLDQHGVAGLVIDVVFETDGRGARIELERILSLLFQKRIVAIQLPVTGSYCKFTFFLGFTHTKFQTMIDTWSIGNNQGWSWISFSFLNGFEILTLVRANRNLGYINITIAHSHHTKVFLTNSFTRSCKFGNSAKRSRF